MFVRNNNFTTILVNFVIFSVIGIIITNRRIFQQLNNITVNQIDRKKDFFGILNDTGSFLNVFCRFNG